MRSASRKTTRSPVVAASDFHRASPLPGRVPCAGSTSVVATTSAPAARATAAVSSVESESTTSSSSTRGTRRIHRSRRSATSAPTVAASFRAGRTTLTRCPPRRLARSSAGRSRSARLVADVVRCWNQARASGLIAPLSVRTAEPARTPRRCSPVRHGRCCRATPAAAARSRRQRRTAPGISRRGRRGAGRRGRPRSGRAAGSGRAPGRPRRRRRRRTAPASECRRRR